MAKLRKGVCYRRIERPYTRKSRKREKSYVRGAPYPKIVLFDMGNRSADFPYRVSLISKDNVQIRHNALEAARVAVNKKLSKKVGEANYYFKVKVYPHHVLRENPLAAGAGADRFQTGMSHSFGKPIGLAAQVKKGQEIMYVDTTEKYVDIAKEALKQAIYKCPMKGHIEVVKK
ncbi:MAG: 50S ribosomal protein L16 [Nanoarchaeota archaeon]|nr:50S ribosomal protein L16 [Nanoarchaeota archaeon]